MIHTPVLLKETINLLSPQKGESYLDLTAGYGGHAGEVLRCTGAPHKAMLVDRDQYAIDFLTKVFLDKEVRIIKDNFLNATKNARLEGMTFDLILADLGVSSPHLNNASRGFSFQNNGPLDMRMDQSGSLTASEIVNNWPEQEISRILYEYGEEKKSRRIAQSIVGNRPIATTHELAKIIESSIGWVSKGQHPATRSFQAIRIAVNGELELLEKMIPEATALLEPGGRLAVITFHSLEDRIVKRLFSEMCSVGYDAEYQLLTKKPISPTHSEIVNNPRARSAKLRALAKIKTRKGQE